jgi:hypothetical protein
MSVARSGVTQREAALVALIRPAGRSCRRFIAGGRGHDRNRADRLRQPQQHAPARGCASWSANAGMTLATPSTRVARRRELTTIASVRPDMVTGKPQRITTYGASQTSRWRSGRSASTGPPGISDAARASWPAPHRRLWRGGRLRALLGDHFDRALQQWCDVGENLLSTYRP